MLKNTQKTKKDRRKTCFCLNVNLLNCLIDLMHSSEKRLK
uniref:Uncharacterized protein n=1 Tax=Anguilla anguilla TaxID=7936 RepID=A0A0E9TUC0_ANGAN